MSCKLSKRVMNNLLVTFAALISLFSPAALFAAQNPILLTCKYSHTVDRDGKISATVGEDLVTVNIEKNGRTILNKHDFDGDFAGLSSDSQYFGEIEYQIQSGFVYRSIKINRYTGAFEAEFSLLGKGGGITHFGKCEQATKKF